MLEPMWEVRFLMCCRRMKSFCTFLIDSEGCRVGCNAFVVYSWFRFAPIERVSFQWLSIECSIASRSSTRVSVVRVRRRDRGVGAASAFRPVGCQLIYVEKMERGRDLPCRMATFRRIMVDFECCLMSTRELLRLKLSALVAFSLARTASSDMEQIFIQHISCSMLFMRRD